MGYREHRWVVEGGEARPEGLMLWTKTASSLIKEASMFDNPFTHRKTIRLTLVLGTALWLAPLLPNHANAEGAVSGADLRARFEALSQHGNVECSVQFEKLIGTMPAD